MAAAHGSRRVADAQQIMAGRAVDIVVRLWNSLNLTLFEGRVNATCLGNGLVPVLKGGEYK